MAFMATVEFAENIGVSSAVSMDAPSANVSTLDAVKQSTTQSRSSEDRGNSR